MQNVEVEPIREYLQAHREAMIDFLAELVRLESPSDAPQAQQPVFFCLEEALQDIGYAVTLLPGQATGGQLYARPPERSPETPVQLLVGHCDTVWPMGTLSEMPVKIEEGRMRGPGVYDMKGGLAQMVYALRALHALGLEPAVTPLVFVNSDEEIGSPESRPRIQRLARIANRAFVLEPSLGRDGKLKTARKGIARFTIDIQGKPAHAGLDPSRGASAIQELSYVIQKLHALSDPERGITVNVGMIEGGQRPNVVAPTSRAVADVRVLTWTDAQYIAEKITTLEATTPGVTLRVEGGFGRPPMERNARNRRVWRLAQQAGQQLGLELGEATAGGASDGNETGPFTATLDGLGAVGDGAHARHEFVFLDPMIERTALLVLLLLADPMQGHEPNPSSYPARIQDEIEVG